MGAREWVLEDLDGTGDEVPDREATECLISQFRETWMPQRIADKTVTGIMVWALRRLDIDGGDFSWNSIESALTIEQKRVMRLASFADHHKLDIPKIGEVHAIHQTVRDAVTHLSRLRVMVMPRDSAMWQTLPHALRNGDMLDQEGENMHNYDPSDLKPFHKVFLYLRPILEACQYRRAKDMFFHRVTIGDIATLAYDEALLITTFVSNYTAHYTNFSMWKTITQTPVVRDMVVRHLTNEPLLEAPDLDPCLYLRSYAGDEFGRGCGVYDSRTDVFFPYCEKDRWANIASMATEARGRLHTWNLLAQRAWRGPRDSTKYWCTAPSDQDVAIVHLQSTFTHDIAAELDESIDTPLHQCWREAFHFECAGRELQCGELAGQIASRVDCAEAPPVGAAWVVTDARGAAGTPCDDAALEEILLEAYEAGKQLRLTEEQQRRHGPFTDSSCVPLGDALFAMPAPCSHRKPRARLTHEEWTAAWGARPLPGQHDYFVCGAGDTKRYFLQDTGATWHDCHTPELDQIFRCQHFADHDRFWIYALLGRLFFEVGELDEFEMTLFFEGIGGSGKSTILRAMMGFWPKHLLGILSSNMQPQFGMGSLAHAVVCMCTEVSEDLNLPQEEWQDATGGAQLCLAVKNKEPLTVTWRSQFLWAGNNFPKAWKNAQLQVSRRLAGVGLNESVKPRDASVPKKIEANRAALQRRCILAYFTWLHLVGNLDPMSREDRMPPAFLDYFRRGQRLSNPLTEFLANDKYVVMDPRQCMLFDSFKQRYNSYLSDEGMPKVGRFTEDKYKGIFSDKGISVVQHPTFTYRETVYTNVKVVHGVRDAAVEAS